MAKQKSSTAKAAAKSKPSASRKKTTAKAASTKKRTGASRSSRSAAQKAGDQELTIDRRRKSRRSENAGEASPATPPQLERRVKTQRRRQIDPTTCERDYSDAEVAFMNAMDEYKRTSGRMFPTCSEVLEVIRNLGYVQLTPAELKLLGRDEASEAEETAALDAAESDCEDAEALEDAELAV